jgi:hypothetical protein
MFHAVMDLEARGAVGLAAFMRIDCANGVIEVGHLNYGPVLQRTMRPKNRASGCGVGVIGNLHLFLEDILPKSLGKPLFASASGENTPSTEWPQEGHAPGYWSSLLCSWSSYFGAFFTRV